MRPAAVSPKHCLGSVTEEFSALTRSLSRNSESGRMAPNPHAFLRTSRASLFMHSTAPRKKDRPVRNRVKISGRCMRTIFAACLHGLDRERISRRHLRLMNLSCCIGERRSQSSWKSPLRMSAHTVRRLCLSSSASLSS